MQDFKIEQITEQYLEAEFDLAILSLGYTQLEREYDLGLTTKVETSELLLRRAIKSPHGYISRYVLDGTGLNKTDVNHGNRIYEDLSEGMTISTIAKIKSHVNQAAQYAPEVQVSNIEISVPNLDSLEIAINYNINNESKFITTQLVL